MKSLLRPSSCWTRSRAARTGVSVLLESPNAVWHNRSTHRSYSAILKANIDGRTRLSSFWVPITKEGAPVPNEDSHSKLIRARFIRQAHSGIYHMLPLGRRVQDKLEALIDKHMSSLGASKLALSSISSEELWAQSGRLGGAGAELFRFKDRKDANYLLSPTHEEEITSLISSLVTSYKQLPVRVYQISRKYRDELRPRQGLLRSREFIMKDLYTFDYKSSLALETYDEVRRAYIRLFNELKIPYLVAEADSGSIGGDLSHEFHFPTAQGEDSVISCNDCDYVANEELAVSTVHVRKASPDHLSHPKIEKSLPDDNESSTSDVRVWRAISKDRQTLINVWYLPTSASGSEIQSQVNIHAIKSIISDLDASVEDPVPLWKHHQVLHASLVSTHTNPIRLVNLVDSRITDPALTAIKSHSSELPFWPDSLGGEIGGVKIQIISQDPSTGQSLNLMRIRDGDKCARCSTGTLKVQKAIELGHTFHLGTRYSEPMGAMVAIPAGLSKAGDTLNTALTRVPMQMGCHGIGVSRIIAAVADSLADNKGLNWPRVMAPYEAVIVPANGFDEAAVEVYDALSRKPESSEVPPLDLILDDRDKSFPRKMKDADLIGYPVIVVVGKEWAIDRKCEVQCRRLHVRRGVPLNEVSDFIQSLLRHL